MREQRELDDALLIAAVRQHEELYNVDCPGYTNNHERDKAWVAVGALLHQEANICKERWRSIRDNYRKALLLRKKNTKKGKMRGKMRTPKYNKELSFIIPFLNEEDKRGMKRKDRTESETDGSCSFENVAQNFSSYSPPVSNITGYVLDPNLQDSNSERGNQGHERFDVTDPLTDFFLTMAKTVKTFPREEQLKIKSELFQIVNKVELKMAMSNELHHSVADQPSISQSIVQSSGSSINKLPGFTLQIIPEKIKKSNSSDEDNC